MDKKIEALKLALEALVALRPNALTSFYTIGDRDKAITAIKEALEGQPEQEPDAPDIVVVDDSNSQTNTMSWAINLPLPIGTPLYTSPPVQKQEPVKRWLWIYKANDGSWIQLIKLLSEQEAKSYFHQDQHKKRTNRQRRRNNNSHHQQSNRSNQTPHHTNQSFPHCQRKKANR